MRTSDQNQSPFMRPNLISSPRRGGLEDSILARLERDPGHHGGATNWLRIAWMGTALLLVATLVGILVWLASDGAKQPSRSPRAMDPYRTELSAMPAAGPGTPHQSVLAALVIDAAPEVLPPLRLLEPAPARAAPPTQAKRPPVQVARTPRPTAPVERSRARPTTPKRNEMRQPSRTPTRSAGPVIFNEVDAADDPDVALISAVIYHANGHATGQVRDRESAACRDASCH